MLNVINSDAEWKVEMEKNRAHSFTVHRESILYETDKREVWTPCADQIILLRLKMTEALNPERQHSVIYMRAL